MNKICKQDEKIFLSSAEPEEAKRDYQKFLTVYQNTFHTTWPASAPFYEKFLKLFGNSRFLSHYMIKHPEAANVLNETNSLDRQKIFSDYYTELNALVMANLEQDVDLIRIYKYRELARITIQDLNGYDPLLVLQQLSDLARAILSYLDTKTFLLSCQKWGEPKLASGHICRYHILQMGKMGGRELNYSSDIDLIAFYESDDGETTKGLSLHEFYAKHIQQLTHFLQDKTAEGFLFRVDWDLRPEGKAGLLVNTLNAMLTYYEGFGANWERQAMSKANPGAGDESLGREFLEKIQPFVYPKYYQIEGVHSILELKRKVHNQYNIANINGFHVKLGLGGIREIEFFVQALSMIFGGKDPTLRHYNTMESIHRLEKASLISRSDAILLQDAYLFLRELENSLQMVDEAQTHLLAHNPDEHVKAAKRLGYQCATDQDILHNFDKELFYHTRAVNEIFNSLFTQDTAIAAQNIQLDMNEDRDEFVDWEEELRGQLDTAIDFEQKLNELHTFKAKKFSELMKLETNLTVSRKKILQKVSRVAELICQAALGLAEQELLPKYGKPTYQQLGMKYGDAKLVVLGMGKLGGAELGYGSDLDMIFVYSEPGQTSGNQSISNGEYFAKLVQKFLFILSVPMGKGRAYEVDTQLRPSGNQGPLVTSLEGFLDYHIKHSQLWEKQALLRARPIAGNTHLANILLSYIQAILFSEVFSQSIAQDMHHLRVRVEKELAKENEKFFDFKKGKGGIFEIEFILQYLQLRYGAEDETLQVSNSFDLLDILKSKDALMNIQTIIKLKEIYTFYRTLESKLYLLAGPKTNRLSIDDPLLDQLVTTMEFVDKAAFLKTYHTFSSEVREIYNAIFVDTTNNVILTEAQPVISSLPRDPCR